jgi:hypothetical protein
LVSEGFPGVAQLALGGIGPNEFSFTAWVMYQGFSL